MQHSRVAGVEQFLDNQWFKVLFVTPENHQDDNLELGKWHGVIVEYHRAFNDQFPQRGRDQVGCFKKGDEPQAVETKLLLFRRQVDP